MNRIMVIAPNGLRCPRQNGSAMIGDDAPVEVPDNRYYRRMVADGSLLLYVKKQSAPAIKQKPAKGDKNDNSK